MNILLKKLEKIIRKETEKTLEKTTRKKHIKNSGKASMAWSRSPRIELYAVGLKRSEPLDPRAPRIDPFCSGPSHQP
jgi:hypothetical protein